MDSQTDQGQSTRGQKRTLGPIQWMKTGEGVRWWRIKVQRAGASGFTFSLFVHRHHVWKWETFGRVWLRGERKFEAHRSGRLRRA